MENRLHFLFGLILVASFAAAHCGGNEADQNAEDSSAGTSSETAGSSGTTTGASPTGMGGSQAGDSSGGAGASSTGQGGSDEGAGGTSGGQGGSAAGAAGSDLAGGAGSGSSGAAGAGFGGGSVIGCPLEAPQGNATCATQGDTCTYSGEECMCQPASGGGFGGGGRHGGDGGPGFDAASRSVWSCNRVRDAGGGGPPCPATVPANGDTCNTQKFCLYGDASVCVCGNGGGGGGKRDGGGAPGGPATWTCR